MCGKLMDGSELGKKKRRIICFIRKKKCVDILCCQSCHLWSLRKVKYNKSEIKCKKIIIITERTKRYDYYD